jgi:hypothetical protein
MEFSIPPVYGGEKLGADVADEGNHQEIPCCSGK